MAVPIPPISAETLDTSNNLNAIRMEQISQSNNSSETNIQAIDLTTTTPTNDKSWNEVTSYLYNKFDLNDASAKDQKLSAVDKIKTEMTPNFEVVNNNETISSFDKDLNSLKLLNNKTQFTYGVNKVVQGISKSFTTLSTQG